MFYTSIAQIRLLVKYQFCPNCRGMVAPASILVYNRGCKGTLPSLKEAFVAIKGTFHPNLVFFEEAKQ